MLLRFIAENIASFKDAVEFNAFPSSKSKSHDWHRRQCGHAEILRMSAIYGANGAGKSNLLGCIDLLTKLVKKGRLSELHLLDDLSFRFSEPCHSLPSELAIEFYHCDKIFYYHISFDKEKILTEDLSISLNTKDTLIFSRKDGDIEFRAKYLKGNAKEDFIETFMDALDRIVKSDMPLLSYLGMYYQEEVPIVAEAFAWFCQLQIVLPESITGIVPFVLDRDNDFATLVQSLLPELGTGMQKLSVKKEEINEEIAKRDWHLANAIKAAKQAPGMPQVVFDDKRSSISNIIFENGVIRLESLVSIHSDDKGNEVEVPLSIESDGTKRLIEYMPLLYSVLHQDRVFIVDEIERSIHPILIKSIMRKLSESKIARGQLIFTTHESCLLDQEIFRPDEIWFAQKDVEQATQLYSLSDYNIHKTANIENGYLNGRYGGIPFLSNLQDLHW